MAENPSLKERSGKKEIKFNRNDLSPFKHLLIGSTYPVSVDGNIVMISSSRLGELFRNEITRKILLAPISITEHKRTLEEVKLAREKGEIFSGALLLFELVPTMSFLKKGINLTFKPGELDSVGQLATFEIYLLRAQGNNKIDIPNDPQKELPLSKNFAEIVEYVGERENAMKFRIKQ